MNFNNNDKIVFIESSDWHFGHDKTPTENIFKGVVSMLPDDGSLQNVDYVIIAGDVYDHDLYFHSNKVRIANAAIHYVLRMAEKYGFTLIVLEGTPGHDWKQSISFVEIAELANIKADVHYVQNLEILYFEKHDIHMLFIPDEWRTRTEDTRKDVIACLKRHNLTKVDYAVMHGCFPHQLPGVPEEYVDMHNPNFYLNIVERFIFIGHIHVSSQYKRIVASGSLDAIAHGEEGRYKGWVRAECFVDKEKDTVQFIKNPHAMPYHTINLTGKPIEYCVKKVEDYIAKIRHGHIRIISNVTDPANNYFLLLKKQYPEYTWVYKDASEKSKRDITKEIFSSQQRIKLPTLTRNNLRHMVMDRIKETRPDIHEQCETILCEVINECAA